MKDENKTRSQLIDELQKMRKRVADLERKVSIKEHPERLPDQDIRESEERFRLALDATNDGIWDWDPRTGRAYFSPRYYTMLDYEPDEFSPTYDNWRRLIHPNDVEAAEAAVQRALEEHTSFSIEFRMKAKNGAWRWILGRGKVAALGVGGQAVRVAGSHTDITDHKRTAEALEKRIVALTQPLEDVESIAFEDLFNLSDIQHLQDLYAEAFGVAALITHPDGTPITQPSNFTVLCSRFIRSTEKGSKNCNLSDASIGRHNPDGPNIQPCLSAGLCNAGASITVGGRHIANWLIGQVRNENQKEEDIMAYARELGADENAFRAAYRQVPIMSQEQFERVAQVLFVVANQLSTSAYQNVQQARFITDRKRFEESLRLTQFIFDKAPIGIWRMGTGGEVLDVNEQGCASLGYTREELCRMIVFDFAPGFEPGDWEIGTKQLNETGTKTTEAFHQRKSGETIPIQVIEKLMRYEGQEYRLAFVQDISERRRTEESLRLARFIIDSANIGIYRIAQEGQIKEVNQRAAELLGCTKQELETLSMSDIDPLVARDSWCSNWQSLIAQGARNLEREHRKKDGSLITVEVNSNFLEYEGQQYAIAFVQDISERKRNEEALREKDQLLHDIGKLVKIGAWKFNPETGKATSTDEVARIYDLEPDQQVNVEHGLSYYHGVHREKIEHAFSQAVEKGTPYDLELEIISAKGIRKWVRTSGHPVIKDGRVIQVEGSFQDITERRKAEQALQISEARLKEAQKLAGLGYWEWNVNTGKVDWSKQMYEILHLDPFAFLPQIDSIIALSPWPEDNKRHEEIVQRFLQTKEKGSFDQKFLRPDGSIGYFHSTFEGKFDGDGNLTTMQGTVIDITERKKVEEELRQLRNYLANIIDSMPSVLVGVDMEGRVTQWNKQAEKVTGRPSGQVLAKSLNDVFNQLADQFDTIKTAIRERRVINSPKIARKTGQETRFEDITIFPLVTNGVEGAVIRVDDVTERVRLEEMMIQSEKMLSVGGLAAGMAHEINNPLAGILQSTAVLSNRLIGDLPANHEAAEASGTTMKAIRNYLEIRKLPGMIENIRASGSRATTIVKNMLSFARKSDKVVSIQNLATLLDQTLELVQTDYDMKKQYDFKQIKLVREYDDEAVQVPCEASKIQQVYMNILKNGAEAMADVSDLPAPPAFVLRVRNDGDWVRVEIEDNGPGMDENTRRRIFEPFFTTKPVGKGTGLGLSVSYFIITEDHNGEMRVHPSESGGTRFVIRLHR